MKQGNQKTTKKETQPIAPTPQPKAPSQAAVKWEEAEFLLSLRMYQLLGPDAEEVVEAARLRIDLANADAPFKTCRSLNLLRDHLDLLSPHRNAPEPTCRRLLNKR